MKNHSVLWTETTVDDLDSIIEYVSIENPDNAVRILQKIKEKCALLYGNPLRGRVVPELNHHGIVTYRELIISPWRVVYRVEKKFVYVLAVIDGRRNLEDILLDRIIKGGRNGV